MSALLRVHWKPLVAVGLFNATLPFLLVTWAERWVDSSLAGILSAAPPIFSAVFALRLGHPRERVTGWRLVGLALGFAGVVELIGGNPSGGAAAVLGSLMILLATASVAAASLYSAHRLSGVPVFLIASVAVVTSGLATLPIALSRLPEDAPGLREIGAAAVLGVGGSGVAYVLFYRLLAEAGASRALLINHLVPPLAVFYGAVFLHESVGPTALVGLALILVGIGIAGGRAPRQPPDPAALTPSAAVD